MIVKKKRGYWSKKENIGQEKTIISVKKKNEDIGQEKKRISVKTKRGYWSRNIGYRSRKKEHTGQDKKRISVRNKQDIGQEK